MEWLWPRWLAPGELALLEGDPGVNKSRLALDLCARLSSGRPMPDGTPGPGPATAIFINAEDPSANLIRPRLEAQGADLSRILVIDDTDDDLQGVVDIASLAAALDEVLARTGARLVVIDPITDFLGPNVVVGSETSVRRALAPLRRLARKHGCAILLLRHLNKDEGNKALYRGLGSIAFMAVCRLCWVVAPDPDDPTRHVLAQQKNTYFGKQPSWTFQVQRQGSGEATLTWIGESSWTNDRLLGRRPSSGRSQPARARAQEFLTNFLRAGPRLLHDIWKAAQEQGLSARTVNRAKRESGIRSAHAFEEGQRRTYWLLPTQQLAGALPPDAGPPGLEPWLARLREEFPAANPLDEPDDE
jgi:hypothetical protein